MFRFSVALVAALALVAATAISISPASAASGAAYDKCMAKCMKTSPKESLCPYKCQTSVR
jgi:hypothetical protein